MYFSRIFQGNYICRSSYLTVSRPVLCGPASPRHEPRLQTEIKPHESLLQTHFKLHPSLLQTQLNPYSRCYRPRTAARCTLTDQFKTGATDTATVQATRITVTDPIQLQELLLQTPFKLQKPTVTHPVQDRNHCYRPSTSYRD